MEQPQPSTPYELYEALFKVKQELGTKFHEEQSLDNVLAAIEPLVQKHGLLILQYPGIIVMASSCAPTLTTRIVHIATGHHLDTMQLLVTDKPGHQGLGTAETYARRRNLMDIFGIATKDEPLTALPAIIRRNRASKSKKN